MRDPIRLSEIHRSRLLAAIADVRDTVMVRMTRYFHYLSRSKVDMLYGQLDMSPSSRSTRIGFDVKVLSAGHEVHRPTPQPSMYEKLRAVEEALDRSERPGSIDEPQPYIRDRADLWSIVFPGRTGRTGRDADASETVLFCGESREGRPFVLGGSAAHLQPAAPSTTEGLNSNFLILQRELLAFVSENSIGREGRHRLAPALQEGYGAGDIDDWGEGRRVDVESFMYDAIKHLAELRRARDSGLSYVGYSEFLARLVRKVHPTDDRWSPYAVLGTPLYVSHVELDGQLQW